MAAEDNLPRLSEQNVAYRNSQGRVELLIEAQLFFKFYESRKSMEKYTNFTQLWALVLKVENLWKSILYMQLWEQALKA